MPTERRNLILSRAAEWNERSGHWLDAVDYALAAGSAPLACAMLERVAPTFVRDRGDLRQYIEWIETLHRGGHVVGWVANNSAVASVTSTAATPLAAAHQARVLSVMRPSVS